MGGIPGDGDNTCAQAIDMKKKSTKAEPLDTPERAPYRVRLPGFISDKEVGLGDVIQRATYAIGIKPCGGCGRRAAALNRLMVFTGPRSR
jgi:hypothetical protein